LNAKKAKKLRAMARQMVTETAKMAEAPPQARGLMINPKHEQRFKEMGASRVSAVNAPHSDRGVYRWLKNNA
jgi:hypothetical protein